MAVPIAEVASGDRVDFEVDRGLLGDPPRLRNRAADMQRVRRCAPGLARDRQRRQLVFERRRLPKGMACRQARAGAGEVRSMTDDQVRLLVEVERELLWLENADELCVDGLSKTRAIARNAATFTYERLVANGHDRGHARELAAKSIVGTAKHLVNWEMHHNHPPTEDDIVGIMQRAYAALERELLRRLH
jgi:hypothetical protein